MTKTRFAANLAMLEFIGRRLGDLKNDLVFLGGSTTALFITDPNVPDIRATLDVDCIVDVLSRSDYYMLERKLGGLGFKQDINEGNVICRWHYEGAILDVIPTSAETLSFGNDWYTDAVKNSVIYRLADDLDIKIVTAPYFVATKIEAFNDRGNNDFLASHDLEDLIAVIDGRIELKAETINSDKDLRNFISGSFSQMLEQDRFLTAIPGHLNTYGDLRVERTRLVTNRIKEIATLKV